MNADHDAARKVIRSAAEAILKAMKTVSLYSESNIEDPDRFERELEALTRLGVQKTSIVIQKGQRGAGQTAILANPRPKRTRPKLQSVVVMLHSAAVELLTHAGLTPTTGTGANVARLGALLCVAAGVPLMSGESTKAARLACSPRELLADSGITFQEVLPNLNP